MTAKNTLQKVEREVENEVDALVEDERAAERDLISSLDEAADRARAALKRDERDLDSLLSADARKLRELADRVEKGVASDLDQVALELLVELDDALGRARASVRSALARRRASA